MQTQLGNPVTVVLTKGRYDLASTLKLTPEDSGTSAAPTVWRSSEPGGAILSGGSRVQGWSVSDAARGIWVASVPATSRTRQLYVNGTRAPIAQATPAELGMASGWTGTSSGYTTTNQAMRDWFKGVKPANSPKVEFIYDGKTGPWTQSRCLVTGVSDSGTATAVTMLPTCWNGMTARPPRASIESGGLPNMSTSTVPTTIANHPALLSSGEWYLDETADLLYYALPQGQVIGDLDITMPRLERLVTVAGSLANPVHDIRLEGIQFSYATWMGPSDTGFAEVQSNLHITGTPSQGKCNVTNPVGTCPYGALTQPLGNVDVSGSRNISLVGNTFTGLGGAALSVRYGATNTLIEGNEITATSATGLYLGCSFDPMPTDSTTHAGIKANCTPDPALVAGDTIGMNEVVKNTRVANNVVHGIGLDYAAAPGITILFGQELELVHNEVFNVPYTGITGGIVQGHATDGRNPARNPNVNARNEISRNLIYNYMQKLHDGGAIYLEGHQGQYILDAAGKLDLAKTLENGMLASGNVAFNDGPSNFTYYDDAGSQFIRWDSNVTLGTGGASQGGCSSGGYLWTTNNYFSKAQGYYPCGNDGPSKIAEGNKAISARASLSEVPESIVASAGTTASFAALSQTGAPVLQYVSDRASDGRVLVAVSSLNLDTPIYAGTTPLTPRRVSSTFVEVIVPNALVGQTIAVGTPNPWTRVNESDPSFTGSGWTLQGGRTFGDYQGDVSYASTNGSTATIKFTGTRFRLYGEKNSDQGEITVSIDGGAAITVDTSAATRQANIPVFESVALASGQHTVTIVKKSGAYAVLDGYSYMTMDPWVRVNESDASFTGSGWTLQGGRNFGDYQKDVSYATVDGSTATIKFTGAQFRLYGEKNSDQGEITVSIDGGAAITVDTSAATRQANIPVFESGALSSGQHTVTIVKKSGKYAVLDGYSYTR